jgi:hypothetical protein
MSTTLTSGHEPFPALPRVSLEIPDGWEPTPNPEVVVATAISEWQGFRTNVCVTAERLEGHPELLDVARSIWERFKNSPEFEENGSERITAFGGRDAVHMEGAFVMPDVDVLYQVVVLTVVPHDDSTDVVYAVGTTGSQTAKQLVPVIRSIITSAVLDEPADVA